MQRGVLHRVRNQVDADFAALRLVGHGIDRQAHAVHGDRALVRQVLGQLARRQDAQLKALAHRREVRHATHAVDVARDDVAAQPVVRAQGFFQIHRPHAIQPGGARQRFGRNIDGKAPGRRVDLRRCHAGAVERDAVAESHVLQIAGRRFDDQLLAVRAARAQIADLGDAADGGDDACEHEKTPRLFQVAGFSKRWRGWQDSNPRPLGS